MSAQQSHSGPLSLISCVSARESSPIDDVVESKSETTKKKRFHPFRNLRRMFRRKNRQLDVGDIVDDVGRILEPKSCSTGRLIDDEQTQSRRRSSSLAPGLSLSHDSVFKPDRTDSGHSSSDLENSSLSIPMLLPTPRVPRFQAELADVIRRRVRDDSDDEDLGLPRSRCSSLATDYPDKFTDRANKSQSSCSEGSLLSTGSSLEDDLQTSGEGSDLDLKVTRHILSHSAAKHKMAVRPRRNHAPGAKKSSPKSVASLPVTPEVNEETSWQPVSESSGWSQVEHMSLAMPSPLRPETWSKSASLPHGAALNAEAKIGRSLSLKAGKIEIAEREIEKKMEEERAEEVERENLMKVVEDERKRNSLNDEENRRPSLVESQDEVEGRQSFSSLHGEELRRQSFTKGQEEEPRRQSFTKAQEEEPKRHSFTKGSEEVPRRQSFTKSQEEEPKRHSFTKSQEEEPKRHSFTKGQEEEPKRQSFTKAQEEEPRRQSFTKEQEDEPKRRSFTKSQEEEAKRHSLTKGQEEEPRRQSFSEEPRRSSLTKSLNRRQRVDPIDIPVGAPPASRMRVSYSTSPPAPTWPAASPPKAIWPEMRLETQPERTGMFIKNESRTRRDSRDAKPPIQKSHSFHKDVPAPVYNYGSSLPKNLGDEDSNKRLYLKNRKVIRKEEKETLNAKLTKKSSSLESIGSSDGGYSLPAKTFRSVSTDSVRDEPHYANLRQMSPGQFDGYENIEIIEFVKKEQVEKAKEPTLIERRKSELQLTGNDEPVRTFKKQTSLIDCNHIIPKETKRPVSVQEMAPTKSLIQTNVVIVEKDEVILRRKSQSNHSDEPELMKVFARRSLKAKDDDDQEGSRSSDKENEAIEEKKAPVVPLKPVAPLKPVIAARNTALNKFAKPVVVDKPAAVKRPNVAKDLRTDKSGPEEVKKIEDVVDSSKATEEIIDGPGFKRIQDRRAEWEKRLQAAKN